jgi:hypothetical protein
MRKKIKQLVIFIPFVIAFVGVTSVTDTLPHIPALEHAGRQGSLTIIFATVFFTILLVSAIASKKN